MKLLGALTGAALLASIGAAHAETSSPTLADGTPLPPALSKLDGCLAETAHDGTKTTSVVAGDALHKVELVIGADEDVANIYSMALGDNYDHHGLLEVDNTNNDPSANLPNALTTQLTTAEAAHAMDAIAHMCDRPIEPILDDKSLKAPLLEALNCLREYYGAAGHLDDEGFRAITFSRLDEQGNVMTDRIVIAEDPADPYFEALNESVETIFLENGEPLDIAVFSEFFIETKQSKLPADYPRASFTTEELISYLQGLTASCKAGKLAPFDKNMG